MRRNLPFVLFLAGLAALSGWLLSRMSLIGRVGINLLHREYKFLKVWYQAAAVVFVVWIILFAVQGWMNRTMSRSAARTVHIIAIAAAALGLYVTYQDFRSDISHGLLRERFHLGAYLFWIGWMAISLFFLSGRRQDVVLSETQVKRR